MRKLLLLCTLSLFCTCSTQDIVEKNIEAYMSSCLSEFEIVSAEYSRLYTSTMKNSENIPSGSLNEDELQALIGCHFLPLSKSLNRKRFDMVISNDKVANEWNIDAATYLKLGFFKLRSRDNDVFDAGFGFIIDSAYNVESALIIDDSKDYKYIYSRAFDKKQR